MSNSKCSVVPGLYHASASASSLDALACPGASTAAAGEIAHLAGTNTGKGVYYIALGQGTLIGARFVPDEEMPPVTLTIGADGWTTFGNLHESNFELPRGVKAYAVSPVEGNPTHLALSEVGAVNIGGAVVVKGPPGTYTFEIW